MEYTDQIKICVTYARIQDRLVDSTGKQRKLVFWHTLQGEILIANVFQSEQGYQFIFSLAMCFYSYPISKHLLKVTRKKDTKTLSIDVLLVPLVLTLNGSLSTRSERKIWGIKLLYTAEYYEKVRFTEYHESLLPCVLKHRCPKRNSVLESVIL